MTTSSTTVPLNNNFVENAEWYIEMLLILPWRIAWSFPVHLEEASVDPLANHDVDKLQGFLGQANLRK